MSEDILPGENLMAEKSGLDPEMADEIAGMQRGEITEYHIYRMLASSVADRHNSEILSRMAEEEKHHATIWKRYSGRDIKPERLRIWFYYLISRIFGITFGIKLMENRENKAVRTYGEFSGVIPEIEEIISDEEEHERQIISLLDEKRLKYVGSIVLGLNDAIVEFTGSLAGFTIALQNTAVIGMVGFIMGIAAALSMAASEYLSQKSDPTGSNPATAAGYTGIAYIAAVVILVLPFLILQDPFIALAFTLAGAIGIIICFTFYTSVAQDLPFGKRFIEMAVISLGIAAVSFIIGILVRIAFNVSG